MFTNRTCLWRREHSTVAHDNRKVTIEASRPRRSIWWWFWTYFVVNTIDTKLINRVSGLITVGREFDNNTLVICCLAGTSLDLRSTVALQWQYQFSYSMVIIFPSQINTKKTVIPWWECVVYKSIRRVWVHFFTLLHKMHSFNDKTYHDTIVPAKLWHRIDYVKIYNGLTKRRIFVCAGSQQWIRKQIPIE